MPYQLEDIQGHTRLRTADVPLFDIKVDFRYKPGTFTPDFEDELTTLIETAISETKGISDLIRKEEGEDVEDNKLEKVEEKAEGVVLAKGEEPPTKRSFNLLVDQLCRLLTWVDITENGQPMPIEDRNVRRIPYAILKAIMKDIKEDINPKETSSATSPAG